jgi:hypothetical protein
MNFSSPAQDVIQRPVVLDQSQTHGQLTADEFRDYYELEWTANEIVSNDYKRVRRRLSLGSDRIVTNFPGGPAIPRRAFMRLCPNLP